jgi:hypothetical protein
MRRVSSDMFKYKFGRTPKVWTISQVHDLYIRAVERSERMRKETVAVIYEIVNEIPKSKLYGKDCHITYFYINKTLYQYEMDYMKQYDSYGTSSNQVNFREGGLENVRENKLHFLLNNTRAIELGEKYHELSNRCKHYEYRIKSILLEMIQDKLVEHFKTVRFFDIPNVIEVDIDERKYIFTMDDTSNGYYRKFNLIGELKSNSLIKV